MKNNKYFLFFLGFCVILLLWVLSKTSVENGNVPSLPFFSKPAANQEQKPVEQQTPAPQANQIGFKKFASEEEFKTYLAKAQNMGASYGIGGGAAVMETAVAMDAAKSAPAGMGGANVSAPTASPQPDRFSQTNVQVLGIDEPDIIKTDGKKIYFSPGYVWGGGVMPMTFRAEPNVKMMPPYQNTGLTNIVSAFPLAELAKSGKIEKSGELLLNKDTLVIFAGEGIFAYDIKDPKNPQKKWDIKYDNSWLASARLYNDKLYIVTRNNLNSFQPCPFKPFALGGQEFTIACTDIYYPQKPMPVDTTFTAAIVNLETGMIDNKIVFIGSAEDSVVYMSEKSLYVAYAFHEDAVKFYLGFFKEKASDIVPQNVISKIEKLNTYDIGYNAKTVELQTIWDGFMNTFGSDDRLKSESDINNRFSDYYKAHLRDIESTGIVKINLDNFSVSAQGNITGRPLNQFSLDEYNGNLRIATTVGGRWWGAWLSGINIPNNESANDVYVLDNNLQAIGSVQNLGLSERIYSARFIEDKGYVVTFKQTDPFYVIDLADPKNPKLAGELKIPGYSGYLHPIGKNKILGVGQEDWQVKISLFDVSDAQNPKELDKYILKEGYTDVLNNHRAFLMDQKHEIFFIPSGSGAYIFSYKGDKIALTKAISKMSARRAVYIEDYLYIFSDNSVTVLNENTWAKEKELDLN